VWAAVRPSPVSASAGKAGEGAKHWPGPMHPCLSAVSAAAAAAAAAGAAATAVCSWGGGVAATAAAAAAVQNWWECDQEAPPALTLPRSASAAGASNRRAASARAGVTVPQPPKIHTTLQKRVPCSVVPLKQRLQQRTTGGTLRPERRHGGSSCNFGGEGRRSGRRCGSEGGRGAGSRH